jgi:hypothetical protein
MPIRYDKKKQVLNFTGKEAKAMRSACKRLSMTPEEVLLQIVASLRPTLVDSIEPKKKRRK